VQYFKAPPCSSVFVTAAKLFPYDDEGGRLRRPDAGERRYDYLNFEDGVVVPDQGRMRLVEGADKIDQSPEYLPKPVRRRQDTSSSAGSSSGTGKHLL
jgi:hypothetical protein